jgi:ATP-dependent Clp protease ATP-binding subunit ClpA
LRQFGARPLKEPFKKYVEDALAEEILPLKLLQVMIFSWTLKKAQELTVKVKS